MNKILKSLAVIVFVASIAIAGTGAFFNDTEVSTGNSFSAGAIDLTIDYVCDGETCVIPFKDLGAGDDFFDYCDVKPGDVGEVTLSWHVTNNPAWGRIRIAEIADWEFGCTEPETQFDTTCDSSPYYAGEGELSQYLRFSAWMDEGTIEGWQCGETQTGCSADPEEGNNIFDGGYEVMIAENMLVDQFADTGIILPEVLSPEFVYYVGLEWNLPFATSNIVQTDSMVASIVMEVVQSRHNPVNPWESTITPLVNGGFETGDFTGWTESHSNLSSVVNSFGAFTAKEGTKFALLETGAQNVYTTVSQDIVLEAGQTIGGWAAFKTNDYLPYNDNAMAQIIVTSSNTVVSTPWQKDVSIVGNHGYADWEAWSWTATTAGTYTIELKVRNVGDGMVDSYGLFDAHLITQ